jgi:hypothetical protein
MFATNGLPRFPVRALVRRGGLGLAFSVLLLAALPGSARSKPPAAKSIKVCFSSTAMFTESCGTQGTATASGLTAQQQTDVINKIQSKYDKALGAGSVTVMSGAAGANDTKIIVNGGQAPGALQGKEYGDAGKGNGPGVCHEGEFTADGLSGNDLVMAIAETVAHEAGHKLGLDHNWDNPPSLMTEGSKVSLNQRKPGSRCFTADDTKKLNKNICKNAEKKDSIGANELGVTVGETVLTPPNQPDDRHLDCRVSWLAGPPSAEFGYISINGEFIFVADNLSQTFFSLLYTGSIDLAVLDGFGLHKLSNGGGSFSFSNPNPDNPSESLSANVVFPSAGVVVQLDVMATNGTTGGFHSIASVPALPGWSLGALTFLALLTGLFVLARTRR